MRRRSILRVIGCVAILLGFAPVARLYWSMKSDSTPLSFPLTLRRGEYTSPSFSANAKWSYCLTLGFDRLPHTFENLCKIGYYEDCKGIDPVAFDWQLVDDEGTVIQQGQYKTPGQRLFWWTAGWETWKVVFADIIGQSGEGSL